MQSLNWAAIPAETVYPGITRQTIQGTLQTMVRYVYQPGSRFPVHSHPQEQITLVISGSIEFTVDGTAVLLGPGEVAVIPPGASHGAHVVGDQVVESFNALSPARTIQPGA
jgi:quercetin dioxygenase-like cupin family protein